MGAILTETNWQSRRNKLNEQINEADAAYRDVALKCEIGTATDDDLIAARAVTQNLKDRLDALDMARRRSREMEATNREADQKQRRADAGAEAIKLLDKREAIAMRVKKAVDSLGSAWQAYRDVSVETAETLAPWVTDLNKQWHMNDMLLALNIEGIIGMELHRYGMEKVNSFSNNDILNLSHSFEGNTADENRHIRAIAARFIPEMQ